ncbi:Glia maturation factor gamma [Armadillidium vulgare]|nr:Glia maturation factor gamma [Armadillidium vulgare]
MFETPGHSISKVYPIWQTLSLEVCSIHPDLKEAIKKFRFRKETNNAAIIMKVNAEDQNVVIEEMLDVEDIDDLKNNITDTQPRL